MLPLKSNVRTLLAVVHDLLAVVAAWLIAFWLRFNLELPEPYDEQALLSLPWVVPLYGAVFYGAGLYRGIWRYASLPDVQRIVLAVGAGALAVPAMLFMLQLPVPRSVLVMSPVLLVMLMGGSRLAYRGWKERRFALPSAREREPVVVLGSADTAASLVKDLSRSPQWQVIGVFDDNAGHRGRQLHGVTVIGAIAELPARQPALQARRAIIAMPEADHRARRRALEAARAAGLQVLTVPSFDDLASGRVMVSQIRKVELDDLLGRDPVQLDATGLRGWLGDRVVMVTGAGGSIGAELCRQVARYQPRRIVLFEQGEFALYSIEQEFRQAFPALSIRCVIGDVKDAARVSEVLAAEQPSVIFHAAAYKHVPMMERNPTEAVEVNVLGTKNLADQAVKFEVESFVMVSTDKAINPTSIMGCSKRMAEIYVQALDRAQRNTGGKTHFITTRFGNVVGSSGSVVPIFQRQIRSGGPLTVTHKEVTRYFMSISESCRLVLEASVMGNGGEIFIFDMGKPVKIIDLARKMIKLSGLEPDIDVKIQITGLREGEKLFEELLHHSENTIKTHHPKIMKARVQEYDFRDIDLMIGLVQDLINDRNELKLVALMKEIVPEFKSNYSRFQVLDR